MFRPSYSGRQSTPFRYALYATSRGCARFNPSCLESCCCWCERALADRVAQPRQSSRALFRPLLCWQRRFQLRAASATVPPEATPSGAAGDGAEADKSVIGAVYRFTRPHTIKGGSSTSSRYPFVVPPPLEGLTFPRTCMVSASPTKAVSCRSLGAFAQRLKKIRTGVQASCEKLLRLKFVPHTDSFVTASLHTR